MKQTAVEWLQVQLNENGKLSAVDFYQAKEMENQQHKETKVKIIDAYNKGYKQGKYDPHFDNEDDDNI